MTGEANAAIEGAFAGGATEVTVNDSHGGMYNLTPEKLDPRARLVQGKKPYSMVEAARDGELRRRALRRLPRPRRPSAGHDRAHVHGRDHARSSSTAGPSTEAGINGLYLGALGVPVGMVSGDDALAEELADWLPWAERVVVKRGVSWQAADSVHPSQARELIRDARRSARSERERAGDRAAVEPLTLEPPIDLRIDVRARRPGRRRRHDPGLRARRRPRHRLRSGRRRSRSFARS